MPKKVTVEAVYEAYQTLMQPSEENALDEGAYQRILQAVNGDDKVKTLAAQFIPKFMHKFPTLKDKALDAQLDLCEDGDQNIRMTAHRGLSVLSKESPEVVSRVADVLGQLLVVTDLKEIATVKEAFRSLFQISMKDSLLPLLRQIQLGDDEAFKEKGFEFLKENVGNIKKGLKEDEELQKTVVDQMISIFENSVSPGKAEFFIKFLTAMPVYEKDEQMKNRFAEAISKLPTLNEKTFKPTDEDSIESFLATARLMTNLPKELKSNAILEFFFTKIVPKFHSIAFESQKEILKAIVKYTSRNATSADTEKFLAQQTEVLLTSCKDPVTSSESLQVFEHLLYIFHNLAGRNSRVARDCVGIFIATGQPDDFDDEVIARKTGFFAVLDTATERSSAFASSTDVALKELNASIAGKEEEEKTEILAQVKKLRTGRTAALNTVKMANMLKQQRPRFLIDSGEFYLSSQTAPKKKEVKKEAKQQPKGQKPSGSPIKRKNKNQPQKHVKKIKVDRKGSHPSSPSGPRRVVRQ